MWFFRSPCTADSLPYIHARRDAAWTARDKEITRSRKPLLLQWILFFVMLFTLSVLPSFTHQPFCLRFSSFFLCFFPSHGTYKEKAALRVAFTTKQFFFICFRCKWGWSRRKVLVGQSWRTRDREKKDWKKES